MKREVVELMVVGLLASSPCWGVDAGFIVQRYGAWAEIPLRVVDAATNGIPDVTVQGFCGIADLQLNLKTDADGWATFKGISSLSFSVEVASPDIYRRQNVRVELPQLAEDGQSFAVTSVPPIVVRRKIQPHRMGKQVLSFGLGCSRSFTNEWFAAEMGAFRGVPARYASDMLFGYMVLTPLSPEDGFQIVKLEDDDLRWPLAAPEDGYVSGPLSITLGLRRSNDLPQSALALGSDSLTNFIDSHGIVFRRKAGDGFAYGVLVIRRDSSQELGFAMMRTNADVGLRSLEPDEL